MQNLLELHHRQASRLVESGAPVFLSVNPVEYHGPHLSLHNDSLISAGLIRDIHERLVERRDWPLLQAGELEVGVDPVVGPGSRAVPFRRVARAVVDACRSLVSLGARRVVLMTFHGSPMHALALQPAVDWLEGAGVQVVSPFNLLFHEVLHGDGLALAPAYDILADRAEGQRLLAGARRDLHAGFLETSLSLHYAPESVGPHKEQPPCPEVTADAALELAASAARAAGRERLADELDLLAWGAGWMALRPCPCYTSSPHLAAAEVGATVSKIIVDGAVELAWAVLEGRERSPRPAFRWLLTLTAGGLLPLPQGKGALARLWRER